MKKRKHLPEIPPFPDQLSPQLINTWIKNEKEVANKVKSISSESEYKAYCKKRIQEFKHARLIEGAKLSENLLPASAYPFQTLFEKKIEFYQSEIGEFPIEKTLNETKEKLSRKGKAGRRSDPDAKRIVKDFIKYIESGSSDRKPSYALFKKKHPGLIGSTTFHKIKKEIKGKSD